MKKLFHDENGQAMVLAAFAMIVLLGFGAFAVDTGVMAHEKSQLQNVADAAALAAVQDLPSIQAAKDSAISYAQKNGMQISANGVTSNGQKVIATTPYKGDAKQVEVVCSKEVDYMFAQAFGMKTKTITARAVASAATVGNGVFDYAIFAGEGAAVIGGSDHNYGGSVYGRDGVSLGNKAKLTGNVVTTSSGTINLGNGSTVSGSVITNSNPITMPDFSELIKAQGMVLNGQAQLDQTINGTMEKKSTALSM